VYRRHQLLLQFQVLHQLLRLSGYIPVVKALPVVLLWVVLYLQSMLQ
jgi:hypothetical protein